MKITTVAMLSMLSMGLVSAADDAAKRLQASADVLTEIMSAPDKAIPQDLLDRSQCVVVVPGLKKGAFIIGGKFGKGFVSCRNKDGVGWSAPGAVRVEGGSFGFQIGGSETDVVMLVMNKSGVNRLLSSRFTLGADASVAAGPVGRSAQADTDAKMTAEILTYSRNRGVFAGIALNGATLREDEDWNRELYNQKMKNRDVVMGGTAAPPVAAPFLDALNKYSSRK